MPISRSTEQKMKEIEETKTDMSPEQFIEPKDGWQCPSCGQVYEQPGLCPIDEAPLTEVSKWTESVDRGGEASTEQVMETGDDLYPTRSGGPRR